MAPILGGNQFGYRVPLSDYVRRHAIMTMAVGLIIHRQAEQILRDSQAD